MSKITARLISVAVIIAALIFVGMYIYRSGYNAHIVKEQTELSDSAAAAAKAAADAIACNNDPDCRSLPDKYQRD